MTSTYDYHSPIGRKTHANNCAWSLQKWQGKNDSFQSCSGHWAGKREAASVCAIVNFTA